MKGIKRCRSWERSYALDTPYPHVNTRKATPRHPAHPPTLRAPPYTHARCNQRIPAVSDATNVCLQRIPTTYPCNMAYTHCRCDQRISATYVHNISLRHIPATYPQYISLIHIPNTYPQYISPKSTTPHAPMDISGNLW